MKHRREILAIAIPAIVSNLTTPLLGLVDVAITGHLGAAVYIAAIAVGGTMFNMLYWLFNFLRMGSSGLTAQAFGAGKKELCDTILFRASFIGLAIGLAMIVLSRPLGDAILAFMDAEDATEALARRYFSICIWGAPAVMLSYAFAGWFIGMQDSRSAMWTAIATNVVNIAVSLTLVRGLGWKIEGVATGTLVAQWASAILGIIIICDKFRPKIGHLRQIFHRDDIIIFFRLNADIFLRTCCLVAVTLWFTHAGALQGPEILAANAILLQLFILFSCFMDGFAYAGEALSGKHYGSGDYDSLKSLIRALMLTGLVCAAIFSAIYFITGQWFIGQLSDNAAVVATACRYILWAVAIPLCGFAAFVWDGIFVGLTRTRAMLISMIMAVAVFFALYFSLINRLGNSALWLAFNSYLLVRAGMQWVIWKRMSVDDCRSGHRD